MKLEVKRIVLCKLNNFQFTSSIYKVNAIKEQMIFSTSIVFETEATLVLLCRLYWTCQ